MKKKLPPDRKLRPQFIVDAAWHRRRGYGFRHALAILRAAKRQCNCWLNFMR
jgi:hypothetical protein